MKRLLLLLFALLTIGCNESTLPTNTETGQFKAVVFFSPRGGCREAVVRLINNSKKFIDVAMFSFTDRRIARALIKAQQRGVRVRVIIDYGNGKSAFCVGPLLERYGIKVRYKKGSGGGLMHNKYAVYDGKFVSTGSFNWTVSANKRNDENLIVIRSEKIARIYEKNFNKLWKLAGLTN
jgi:phosphatidylserine/phosphatidylglycerophosphate/cardiolipin synthase-like enzyme